MKYFGTYQVFFLASCFLLLTSVSKINAQGGTWIWQNGPNALQDPGNYGTQGVASPSNCPRALFEAGQWTDKQGNFWLYGGEGIVTATPGDLWKYDPVTNMWTWVNGPGTESAEPVYGTMGVPSPSNNPGGRSLGYPCWTDTAGDLWLFGGGETLQDTIFGDLWRYHIASNEWTWMGGTRYGSMHGVYGNLYQLSDSAIPPNRKETHVAWTDANNNLWMFGGQFLSGLAGDLWRYNIALGEWAWMGGSDMANSIGSYGTLGVESPANVPCARFCDTHWMDSCFLYMSSGIGAGTRGYLDDVWRFNMTNNEWTWVGGDSGAADNGYYSAYCLCVNTNKPMGRWEERSAQINSNPQLFFMFGGQNSAEQQMNDLWTFNPAGQKWTWISGAPQGNSYGNFGTLGVSSPNNMPPAVMGNCAWADNSGNLWIWGGLSDPGNYNAMWEYIPDTSCMAVAVAGSNLGYNISSTDICKGDTVQISFWSGTEISITPSEYVSWIDSLHAVLMPDSSTVFTIGGFTPCGNYITESFELAVGAGLVQITAAANAICPGDSVQICAPSTYQSYAWNTGQSSACIYAATPGNYYVTAANSNCTGVSNSIYITVYQTPSVSITVSHDSLEVYNASGIQWYVNGNAISNATDSVYVATEPGTYTVQLTDSNGCQALSSPTVISGINSIDEGAILVYPNPSQSYWQLTVPGNLLGADVELFDATGRLVYKSLIANRVTQIAITDAAAGIYELRITGQAFSVVRKLVKM